LERDKINKKLEADELDDVAGEEPYEMDEEYTIEVL
jgi:hypothetical protein